MSSFQKYELPDGQSILIETKDDQPSGGMAVAISDGIRETGKSLTDALSILPFILSDIKSSVFDKLSSPSEVTVEFGAKLSGEVGFIVSKSQAEANFKVTVKWKPSQS